MFLFMGFIAANTAERRGLICCAFCWRGCGRFGIGERRCCGHVRRGCRDSWVVIGRLLHVEIAVPRCCGQNYAPVAGHGVVAALARFGSAWIRLDPDGALRHLHEQSMELFIAVFIPACYQRCLLAMINVRAR